MEVDTGDKGAKPNIQAPAESNAAAAAAGRRTGRIDHEVRYKSERARGLDSLGIIL
jgi:hypothetical protein